MAAHYIAGKPARVLAQIPMIDKVGIELHTKIHTTRKSQWLNQRDTGRIDCIHDFCDCATHAKSHKLAMVRPPHDRYVYASSKVHHYPDMLGALCKGGKMTKSIPMHSIPAEKNTFLDKLETMVR